MNVFSLLALDPAIIALIVVIAVLVVALVVVLGFLANKKKKGGSSSKIIDGVKYDEKNSDKDYTFQHKDVLLARGTEYTVAKDSMIIPGKYQLFAGDERTKYVNMRLTGFVREYKSGSSVILAEGDKITALSHNVILR